ncbi:MULTISPECIES: glycosyltransferase family 4 protein [unclassified Flavobacterium]|uniref:glycosyltransferase family 4 protein n=1 Tax=unclassified Flavobacterium TaxID=196869 RepID=UPI001291DF07|nr:MULTISPECIES: glycosyltransferase family 4 protein [unclassified Flavobacterium]MQP52348.1 glycosyltransferase [Flavobacterium sp. LMO9]MQP62418.1 glycosyltransferase [Flavobacterium sp. LMO6]
MKHLVIIGAVWPEPNSTAAGSRMLQLISLFQKQSYEITFLCSASKSDFSFDLNQISVKTKVIQLNDSSFDSEISELNPNVVLFDRFMMEEQYGWRVIENCPNVLRILDTEDLHFLRKAREVAFKQHRELVFEDYISDVFKREMASIYRCDLTLLISEYEMQLATETFKIDASLLYYLPFLSEEINTDIPKFEERKHFVSIGNFLHEPNWQTVLQLKQLWKAVKKQLPEAELHVYGAYVSEKAKQLHNEKEGFLIKGRAENVADVYSKAKVLLAPIPYGAGLKGKLFEAMQLGLPSITTKVGAEAMNGNLDWNGFISENENDFVEKAIELYTNKSLWETAQKNGYEIIEKRFKKELFAIDFMNRIEELQQNLKTNRNQNFLGQILQHQSLQSTKYMSKWIEAKNS